MRRILRHLFSPHSKIELSKRHRSSGFNTHFRSKSTSIRGYIAEVREKVEASRVDLDDGLDDDKRESVINGNSAFDLLSENQGPVRRGMLMVHGLTDSPFVMRDLAGYFQQQGFRVIGLLLPGHGTRPGDLLNVDWEDWKKEQQHALDLLAHEVDELYLCGFSAGATLSILQSLDDERIRALFVFSPALRIRAITRLACPLSRFRRYVQKAGWFDIQPDDDCFKYGSLTNKAICEVYRMIKALDYRRTERMLDIPVFVATSEYDSTVDSSATLEWFESIRGDKSMLYYTTSDSTRENTRELGFPAGVKRVDVSAVGENITSYSHTSLLSSSENPHYGKEGSYRSCGHYYRLDRERYQRCKNGDADCVGEIFTALNNCDTTQRLTYNPLYAEMLSEISEFLQRIDGHRHPDN